MSRSLVILAVLGQTKGATDDKVEMVLKVGAQINPGILLRPRRITERSRL